MHILLLILKIAGSILGILLLLLLLLICGVLFVPVRYQAKGALTDTQDIQIRGTWLLFVLRILCEIQRKEVSVKIKLFGIPVFQYPKRKPKTDRKKRKLRNRKSKQKKVKQETKKQAAKKQTGTEQISNTQEEEDELQYMLQSQKDNPEPESKNSGTREKKKKIKTIFLKIKEWILNIPQKIKQILKKIAQMKDMFYDEGNRAAVTHIKKEMKYLFRHIRPKKITMDMQFSTGDPARTGQLLGVLCILPVVYRYDMHLVPDFEGDSFYVKGNFRIKGHIRMIHLLCSGIRVFRDKNIRKLIGK